MTATRSPRVAATSFTLRHASGLAAQDGPHSLAIVGATQTGVNRFGRRVNDRHNLRASAHKRSFPTPWYQASNCTRYC
jgi:hypothetical protein